MAVSTGWGRKTWNSAAWGGGVWVDASGLSSALSLGTPIPTIGATVNGLALTMTQGTVVGHGAGTALPAGISAAFTVAPISLTVLTSFTGLRLTITIGTPRLWNEIDETIGNSFDPVPQGSGDTYTEVATNGDDNWTDIPA